MLFSLSLKNMRKSIKDYSIFFYTLVLGVAIFYVFNSIKSQTAVMEISDSQEYVVGYMNNLLSGVSVFVSIVLGFLIVYANNFLIKRRKKEFAVYLTLGMSKKKMSKMLYIETLIIGFISMLIGLAIGIFLSQFMSILVSKIFEADMSRYRFIFSGSAVIKTIIYFGIIYLVVLITKTISVGKSKLIDLLNSSKKSEEQKFRNPALCVIIFLVSSILLLHGDLSSMRLMIHML